MTVTDGLSTLEPAVAPVQAGTGPWLRPWAGGLVAGAGGDVAGFRP